MAGKTKSGSPPTPRPARPATAPTAATGPTPQQPLTVQLAPTPPTTAPAEATVAPTRKGRPIPRGPVMLAGALLLLVAQLALFTVLPWWGAALVDVGVLALIAAVVVLVRRRRRSGGSANRGSSAKSTGSPTGKAGKRGLFGRQPASGSGAGGSARKGKAPGGLLGRLFGGKGGGAGSRSQGGKAGKRGPFGRRPGSGGTTSGGAGNGRDGLLGRLFGGKGGSKGGSKGGAAGSPSGGGKRAGGTGSGGNGGNKPSGKSKSGDGKPGGDGILADFWQGFAEQLDKGKYSDEASDDAGNEPEEEKPRRRKGGEDDDNGGTSMGKRNESGGNGGDAGGDYGEMSLMKFGRSLKVVPDQISKARTHFAALSKAGSEDQVADTQVTEGLDQIGRLLLAAEEIAGSLYPNFRRKHQADIDRWENPRTNAAAERRADRQSAERDM